jgi:hypothetical protein
MNKRIRELHIQAQQEAFNEPIDIENCAVEDIKGFSQQIYEKFAELIVRECMNAVCDPRTTYLESMTESSAMYTARERIRKHFGVKE